MEKVRLTHLSEALGMNRSYVFRMLATFENRGYVERVEKGRKYRLGHTVYEIGHKFLSREGVQQKARSVMEGVGAVCGEAVYLAIPSNRKVLMLDRVDSRQMVSIASLVGRSFPFTQTAAGKVFLAYGKGRPQSDSAAGATLTAELDELRETGVSLDFGGVGMGAACLAAPLFNRHGQVCASLCLVGPDFRFTPTRLETELKPLLKKAGQTISTRLGYQKSKSLYI